MGQADARTGIPPQERMEGGPGAGARSGTSSILGIAPSPSGNGGGGKGRSQQRSSKKGGKGKKGKGQPPWTYGDEDWMGTEEEEWSSSSEEGFKQMMMMIGIFALSIDHRTRVVMACCLTVRIFTRKIGDLPQLAAVCKEATGDLHYHLISLPQTDRRFYGSPHIHAWLAAVEWLREVSAVLEAPAKEKIAQAIKSFYDSVGILLPAPTGEEGKEYMKLENLQIRIIKCGKQVP